MTIFYLDACLPTSVGTLNATAVRPEGDGDGDGMGIGSEKKLENGFERFHRGSRTDGGDGGGEPSENSVPTRLSEGKQNAASEELRGFTRASCTPRVARPAFYPEKSKIKAILKLKHQ